MRGADLVASSQDVVVEVREIVKAKWRCAGPRFNEFPKALVYSRLASYGLNTSDFRENPTSPQVFDCPGSLLCLYFRLTTCVRIFQGIMVDLLLR